MTSATRTFGLLGLALVLTLSGSASQPTNFYDAISTYSGNHDDMLSALLGFLDAEPYSAIKSVLMSSSNGTLFAPTNAAAGSLLSKIGYGSNGEKPLSAADALGIESLKDAVGDSLMMHFVNGSYTWGGPESGTDSGVMHHEWFLTESENRTASTFLGEDVYLFTNENATDDDDLAIYYDMGYSDLAAMVVGKDIIRTNDTSFDAAHEGHVHTIDTVLMSPSLKELASMGAGFNFEDEIDGAEDASGNPLLSTVKSAIMMSDIATFSVLGPALSGAVFAPTNAAFSDFISSMGLNATEFYGDANRVKRVLYEHIIPTEVTASANENTTTEYDTLTDGEGTGNPVSVEFENGDVTMLMNEGESAETSLVGCNFQGGCVYTIGKVLISNDTKNFLMSDFSSPANGNWKDADLLPTGVRTTDADAAEELLETAGLAGLLNDPSNTEEFTFFLPKETARQQMLDALGFADLAAIPTVGDSFQQLLNSYRVSASEYGDMVVEDTAYQTMNPSVLLTKLSDEVRVEDKATGRKLLATDTGSGLSSSLAFDNGKVLYFMDEVPVTEQMVEDAITGSAARVSPSVFTMAAMVIAAVMALLSL